MVAARGSLLIAAVHAGSAEESVVVEEPAAVRLEPHDCTFSPWAIALHAVVTVFAGHCDDTVVARLDQRSRNEKLGIV